MVLPAPRLTLVLGGARSGKSAHAETLVTALPPPWTYLATAEALDSEMADRIARHRAQRCAGWTVIEEPTAITTALGNGQGPILIDCLTLWVSNLMHAGRNVEAEGAALLGAIARQTRPVVMVANEVGLGIVPETALGRAFRDVAGRLNQQIARQADHVIFMVAGLPMVVKDACRAGSI